MRNDKNMNEELKVDEILQNYPNVNLKGLSKTTKILIKVRWSPVLVSKLWYLSHMKKC